MYPIGFSLANPLEMIANWHAPQTIDRFIGGLNITAFPIDRLTMSYRLGFDGYTENAQLLSLVAHPRRRYPQVFRLRRRTAQSWSTRISI